MRGTTPISEHALLLDRCDEVLGSTSLRGHVVADVPVDAYWPALGVVAIVVRGRPAAVIRERLRSLDGTGIKAVAIPRRLAADAHETAARWLREAFDEDPTPALRSTDPSRARPMLSAVLGAAALSRRAAAAGSVLALDPDELEALGILAAAGDGRGPPTLEGLAAALAVDAAALSATYERLERQDLVDALELTDRGRAAVAAWLARHP